MNEQLETTCRACCSACCSACDKTFNPNTEMEFICPNCQASLVGHCGCGSDDVRMDWGVELEGEYPYFWIIECVCGRTMKSRLHNLSEQDAAAKELITEWVAQ